MTIAITGSNVKIFKGIRKELGSNVKPNEFNEQITNIMELNCGEGGGDKNSSKALKKMDRHFGF